MEAHTAVQSGRAPTFRSVETGSSDLISLAAAHINPEWREVLPGTAVIVSGPW